MQIQKQLRRLSIGARLAVGFGLLLCLIAIIIGIGMYGNHAQNRQFESVVGINMQKMRQFNDLLDINNAATILHQSMLLRQGSDIAADQAALLALRDRYETIWQQYLKLPTNDEVDLALRNEIISAREKVKAMDGSVTTLLASGDFKAAIQHTLDNARPAMLSWNQALDKAIAHQEQLTSAANAEARALSRRSNVQIAGGGITALLLGLAAAWLITRSLTQPLAQAMRVADSIAAGRLEPLPQQVYSDEPARLLHSLAVMQQQIVNVIAAQSEMARRHDEGSYSFRMNEQAFSGEYARMVKENNALIASHTGAIEAIIAALQRYAIGDLAVDFPRHPGEKACAHEAMDMLKHNLASISGEIGRLTQAAAAGDFTLRGDSSLFQYAFRDMVENLNTMMARSDDNLANIAQILRSIAEGDLSARMTGDYQGVYARMRGDANTTVEQLTGIVARIQHAASGIHLAAGEIAAGNDDLSRRTEQQAANLEETAASMEELTSTVRQNAEHARQADRLAHGSAAVAAHSGEVVGQVVTTMAQIQTASQRIAEIISVIDSIAFQTNILALNAAVEAARAGEQGRGFAVVASEVRSLAQRAANAAKEIKGLIEDSVSKVAEGSALADKAGATMTEVVENAERVTAIIAEIAAASQEQASGIEQVNRTVMQMDETTQQNAALVEEASAAARTMTEQAADLHTAVAVFKLNANVDTEPAR